MINKNTLITLLIAVTTTACAGFESVEFDPLAHYKASAPSLGTCDRKDVVTFNICTEVIGQEYNDQAYLDILQSSCVSTGGIFSTMNCDRTGSVGTCVVEPGDRNEARATYYPPEHTAASARASCSSTGGIWLGN